MGNIPVPRGWPEGLGPGGRFTVCLGLGYIGEQSRLAEMLEHRDFVDVTVELMVKRASEPWVALDTLNIARRRVARRCAPVAGGGWSRPALS